jgi:hypothetical protein
LTWVANRLNDCHYTKLWRADELVEMDVIERLAEMAKGVGR